MQRRKGSLGPRHRCSSSNAVLQPCSSVQIHMVLFKNTGTFRFVLIFLFVLWRGGGYYSTWCSAHLSENRIWLSLRSTWVPAGHHGETRRFRASSRQQLQFPVLRVTPRSSWSSREHIRNLTYNSRNGGRALGGVYGAIIWHFQPPVKCWQASTKPTGSFYYFIYMCVSEHLSFQTAQPMVLFRNGLDAGKICIRMFTHRTSFSIIQEAEAHQKVQGRDKYLN